MLLYKIQIALSSVMSVRCPWNVRGVVIVVDGRQVDAYAVNELDSNMMHPLAGLTAPTTTAGGGLTLQLRRLVWST